MSRLTIKMAAMTAVAAMGLLALPSAAQAQADHRGPGRVDRAAVAGVGLIELDEPDVVGDRVWFGVRAATAAGRSPHGRFQFDHRRPDGTLVGKGWAEVTCLQVTRNVALLTAVVPEGVGGVKNHAFYVKITDNRYGPDRVAFVQALNGSTRPPRRCIDFDVEFPGAAIRYPVLTGGYTVHGG